MLLSLGMFLILSFLTLLVAFTSEDAMIHNILRNVSTGNMTLNSQIKEISPDELINMGYEHANPKEWSKRAESFGEFASGEKYYHFMVSKDKVILFNSTDFVLTETRIKGIVKLLLIAFIPFLIAAFFISKIIAKRALKPFSTLQTTILKPEKLAIDIKAANRHIKEADIKQIADELVLALEQKEQVLSQQIAFNQGMSHELRTPLQVMTHAVELIGIKNPELMQQNVYMRLVNSMGRIHRISEAMLWLTSEAKSTHQTQVNMCLARMKQDILKAYSNHALNIDLREEGKLSLPMPQEVFEFIIYSLVNNAVHHGKVDCGVTPLHIDITDNALCFKNLVVGNEVENANSITNFGLGLSLIGKLCQRFELQQNIEINNNFFSIKIMLR
jgi:signal transduction histidine kinase